VVSKSVNRAQAKAFVEERRRLQEDEQHKKNVREELAVIETFRNYTQRKRPTATTLGCLIAAVDAYVEQLTGDMHALWASSVDLKRWWDE
jgi:hypothetical protein